MKLPACPSRVEGFSPCSCGIFCCLSSVLRLASTPGVLSSFCFSLCTPPPHPDICSSPVQSIIAVHQWGSHLAPCALRKVGLAIPWLSGYRLSITSPGELYPRICLDAPPRRASFLAGAQKGMRILDHRRGGHRDVGDAPSTKTTRNSGLFPSH